MNGVWTRELIGKERDAALALFAVISVESPFPQPTLGEAKMTEKAIVATKKIGPVFTIVTYLNKNVDRIKAGRLTRMEAINALSEKGVNSATAAGTLARWSRANGVSWSKRPAAAAAKKSSAARAKKSTN
jgi:hypothetical protein